MSRLIIILINILFITQVLFCETAEERLLRKREQKILTYVYQAKNGSRNQKIFILETIINEFERQKYTKNDKKLLDLIIWLSEEGILRQEYENNQLINNFPLVRIKSCQILAKFGGEDSINALINILQSDRNMNVQAAACNAFAEIGTDPRGEVLKAIVYTYRNSQKPDDNFILAIITAVKTIAKENASAYSDALLILSEIQMGNFSSYIREEAFKAIQFLNADTVK